MVSDKTLGKYCGYLSRYVSISIRYHQKESSHSYYPSKSCNEVTCDKVECNLSKNYIGDKSEGTSFLTEIPPKYKRRG